MEHPIRHCPQPSIQKHTRVIAFAEDLLVMTRAESIGEVENNANIKIEKILKWARDNGIKFNEKIKLMLLTRQKRKNRKRLQCI
jgi:hypothetical protein